MLYLYKQAVYQSCVVVFGQASAFVYIYLCIYVDMHIYVYAMSLQSGGISILCRRISSDERVRLYIYICIYVDICIFMYMLCLYKRVVYPSCVGVFRQTSAFVYIYIYVYMLMYAYLCICYILTNGWYINPV